MKSPYRQVHAPLSLSLAISFTIPIILYRVAKFLKPTPDDSGHQTGYTSTEYSLTHPIALWTVFVLWEENWKACVFNLKSGLKPFFQRFKDTIQTSTLTCYLICTNITFR